MAAIAFSSDAAEPIKRIVTSGKGQMRMVESIEEFYELDKCARWIKAHQLKRVRVCYFSGLL